MKIRLLVDFERVYNSRKYKKGQVVTIRERLNHEGEGTNYIVPSKTERGCSTVDFIPASYAEVVNYPSPDELEA